MKTFVFKFRLFSKYYKHTVEAKDYYEAKYLFDGWLIKSVELISAEPEPEDSSIFDWLNNIVKGK